MKTKRVNDVYMREVIDAEIKTIKDDELNAYITYKHILKMTNNCKYYINGILTTLADINYTILEYSPINGDYNTRVFIDDKDNILLYYFDVINGYTYKEDGIYYEDLYLDVLYYQESVTKDSTYIQLDDLKELNDALECNDITKNQYDKAYTTAETIMKELRYDSNKYVNRGLIDYYKFKTSVN